MKNLDLDNIDNLDESFSNANGKIKDWFSDKKNIRNTLLMGPAGALLAARNRKKKAELELAKSTSLRNEEKIKELESANAEVLASIDKLNEAKSKLPDTDNNKEGMSPTLKWSLIGGGILLLVGGIITTIVLIRKK